MPKNSNETAEQRRVRYRDTQNKNRNKKRQAERENETAEQRRVRYDAQNKSAQNSRDNETAEQRRVRNDAQNKVGQSEKSKEYQKEYQQNRRDRKREATRIEEIQRLREEGTALRDLPTQANVEEWAATRLHQQRVDETGRAYTIAVRILFYIIVYFIVIEYRFIATI